MNDARSMRCSQTGRHLVNDRQCFFWIDPAGPLNTLLERLALQQLHREKRDLLRTRSVVKEIEDPTHVRIRDLSRKLDLEFETFHRLLGARDLGPNCLQRDA